MPRASRTAARDFDLDADEGARAARPRLDVRSDSSLDGIEHTALGAAGRGEAPRRYGGVVQSELRQDFPGHAAALAGPADLYRKRVLRRSPPARGRGVLHAGA